MARQIVALLLATLIVACAAAASACENEVVELTPLTFQSLVGGEKPAMVMFYAPWCGHCKALKPDWEKLGESSDCNNVMIGRLDCDNEANLELCSEYEIQGYPTVKGFPANDDFGEDYGAPRMHALARRGTRAAVD